MNITDVITIILSIVLIAIFILFLNIAIMIIFGGLLLVGMWFFVKTSVKRFYNFITNRNVKL